MEEAHAAQDGGSPEQAAEVSTIFVGGLPPDATPRELDNLVRFLPGFVNSKVSMAKGTTLFALFDGPANAQAAIMLLNDHPFDRANPVEPMRVVMAKSNMRATSGPPAPPGGYQGSAPPPPAFAPRAAGWVPAPPQPVYLAGASRFGAPPPAPRPMVNITAGAGAANAWSAPPAGFSTTGAKRPRNGEDPSTVDTVAVVGAAEAGIDEVTLQTFFSQLPGFVVFKPNPRMGGGFAKFASPELAAQAVQAGQREGVPAAIARSSMSAV